MKKGLCRVVCTILLLATLCGNFMGCAGTEKKEKLKVLVAGNLSYNWEQQFVKNEILPGFEKEFNCTVEFEVITTTDATKKINTEQLSGEYVTDLAMVHSGQMPVYINNGWMQDITDTVAYTDRHVDSDGLFNSVANLGDKKYFLPVSSDVYLTVYNKKALPYLPSGANKDSLTWEQFAEWSANIKNGANGQPGKGARTMFPAQPGGNLIYLMTGMGLAYESTFLNLETEVNSANMHKAYEIMLKMAIDETYVSEQANYTYAVEKMKDESAWLTYAHIGPVGEMLSFSPDAFGVSAPPKGDTGKAGSVVGGYGYGIPVGAPNKALANKFLEYMTRPSVQYEYCNGLGGLISPVKEAVDISKNKTEAQKEDTDKLILMGIDVLENGNIAPVPSANYTDWTAVKSVYEGIFTKIIIKDRNQLYSSLPNAASQLRGLKKQFPQEK